MFDELANGRRVKTLTVVDDCSKEAIQIAVDTSIPALYVTRLLDQVKAERGLPKVIRTDNGPEFAGRTMQTWAARNGVELRFIQPGKPVQNAYIESFNNRFRDECLSQHWFASLGHMRSAQPRINNYDANPRALDRSATKPGGSARARQALVRCRAVISCLGLLPKAVFTERRAYRNPARTKNRQIPSHQWPNCRYRCRTCDGQLGCHHGGVFGARRLLPMPTQ